MVVVALGAVFFLTRGEQRAPVTATTERAVPALPASGAAKGGVAADLAAQKMLADADGLLNRGDTPAAKDLYNKARAQYRRAGNAAGEAAAVFAIGKLEHVNGQSDPARAAFGEALNLYRQGNDAAGQARVLVALGDLEKDTFHGVQAAAHYRAARVQWALVPDPKSDIHVMLNLDRAQAMPAGEQRARAVLEQADKIFHNIDDKVGMGDVAMALGMIETALGNQGPAEAAFRWARDYFAQGGAPDKELDALVRVAAAEIVQGYNIAAGDHLREADTLSRGRALAEARVAIAWGDLERLQGRVADAAERYGAAAPVLVAAAVADGPAALLRLGEVQAFLGADDEAIRALQSARDAASAQGDGKTLARALGELGRALVKRGDSDGEAVLVDAVARARQAADPAGEGRALLALGDLALKRNDAGAAATAFADAHAALVRAGLPFGQLLGEIGRGQAARVAGDDAATASALAAATRQRAVLTEPVADAGRLLGLPPVASLYYVVGGETQEDGNPPDPAIVRAAQQTRAANLARFPDALAEARRLVRDTNETLAALMQPR